jgi:hypothetical protein
MDKGWEGVVALYHERVGFQGVQYEVDSSRRPGVNIRSVDEGPYMESWHNRYRSTQRNESMSYLSCIVAPGCCEALNHFVVRRRAQEVDKIDT